MGKHKRKPRLELYFFRQKIRIPQIDEVTGDHLEDFTSPDSDDEEPKFPEDTTEDRISKLPDDTLHFIISSLTMREGAATSILSRRWRNLWSRSATCLEFDDCNLYGHRYPSNILSLKEKERREEDRRTRRKNHNQSSRSMRKEIVQTERTKFVNLVNHNLSLRTASRLHKLFVSFPLGTESTIHIDRWMKLAALQGVSKLKLDLDWSYFDFFDWEPNKRYTFHAQRFGSSLTHLCLKSCVFSFPSRFQGLNSLVYLHFHDCFLTTSDVQNILSKCPSLIFLSLASCDFPDPTILKFVGPSIPIKHLHISDPQGIGEIELRDVNLLCCELIVEAEKVSIKNAPHLIRLMLYTAGNVEILGGVPHLKTLILNHLKRSLYKLKLPDFSAISNITRLAFRVDDDMSNLFEVVSLLNTFPSLQKMDIDMGDFTGRYCELSELSGRVSTTTGPPHSKLKEVTIHAFENYPELIDLTKYLLKNATALERMRIYTTCGSYLGNGMWCSTEDGKLTGKALKEVSKLIKKEARPSTKVLIRST